MRVGFTLIELLVVLSVMALLSSLATPALVQAGHRARVADAASRVHRVWMQARALALTEQGVTSEDRNGNGILDPGEDRNGNGVLDTTLQPWHYGIVLVQPDSGPAWVGLLYDNRSAATIAVDPDASLLLRAPGEPAERLELPPGMRIATAMAVDDAVTITPRVLVLYAQFGTGSPISPAAVAAGSGNSAGLVSLGTSSSPLVGYPAAVLIAADPASPRGARIAIHEAGICVTQVY